MTQRPSLHQHAQWQRIKHQECHNSNTDHLHHQTPDVEPLSNVMVGARSVGSTTHLPNQSGGATSEHFGIRPSLDSTNRQREFGSHPKKSRDEHMNGNSSDKWSDGDCHPHQLMELDALMSQTFLTRPFFPLQPYLQSNQRLTFISLGNTMPIL